MFRINGLFERLFVIRKRESKLSLSDYAPGVLDEFKGHPVVISVVVVNS